ncbi:ScyD/ScyE family protein [Dactylosporangium aurantiacum]|uniref:ScyD/ScyE family protein n=1 Tax=Dactylosporangium aurantiacum TaxID=35754 RepID=A0A9Q9IAM4_9ACTN|nr:ScyD/ScyE family protein [Dactylosporangium aurantiacum]MDG6106634.1 ScyD/ScyE family protein [Dactylosporangium aurantiacum]UWZ50793.1 ScyD/ScyE family protein [Dactylosporangium aurantiacum]
MQRRTKLTLAGLGVTALTAALLPAGPAAAAETTPAGPTVVVHGLNNPRQISVTDVGGLLVAEAGRGGTQCVSSPGGETTNETCIGYTGSVSWVPFPWAQQDGTPIRVLTGLLSGANPKGASATGSQAVAGNLLDIQVAVVDEPHIAVPDSIDKTTYGTLLQSRLLGKPRIVADIAAYEYARDPDGQLPESNPYALLELPGRMLIADAAANDVLQWRDGRLSTFAVLPNIQDGLCAGKPNDNGTTGCDPVPTGLTVDRGGAIYVSALGNFSPNSGRVFKLDGRTGQVLQTWGDLTGVTGVAIDRHGNLYASQLFAGKVTKIGRDGTRTDLSVPFPAGLAISGDTLYVAAYSTAPETGLGLPGVDSSGQVWRFRI